MIDGLEAQHFQLACAALRDGLAQRLEERTPPRQAVHVDAGHILLMPASSDRFAGVKVVSVAPGNAQRGMPTVQGSYVLMDAATLSPVWQGDAAPLTLLRTAAVSMVGVQLLGAGAMGTGAPGPTVVIIGTGPQAIAHAAAADAMLAPRRIVIAGRRPHRVAAVVDELSPHLRAVVVAGSAGDVESADVVLCVTSSPTPVIDHALVGDGAVVVAVGSHTPDAAELPAELIRRAAAYVEDPLEAMKSGDLVQAVARYPDIALAGTIGQLARREILLRPHGPWVFKCVGQGWEDLCVAAALHGR